VGSLLLAGLLGLIQGLTEFLPVSSSGHLILARAAFGWETEQFGLAFDVACHVGTLAAVVIYFWREVVAMAAALPQVLSRRPSAPARQVWLLAAGTFPVVVAGVLFSKAVESTLRTPGVAVVMLALVAIVFFVVERVGTKTRTEGSVTVAEAALLGCAQALALVPGVSRSGSTIAAGMFFGLRRADAARFSFLLGIPAILAAAGKEGIDLVRRGLGPGEAQVFAVGVVVSAVVGYFTVKYFIQFLAGHSLRGFAWYRLAVAAAFVAWWALR
jgi:undecaprenyl-diphosphatase